MIDYWARFGISPLWMGISFVITTALVVHLFAQVTLTMSVKGTRNSYQASTIARTLCLPLFGALTFEVAMDLFTAHWLAVPFDAYLAYCMLRDWERMKGNDDWWTGRGTKLKRKIRSMFSDRSPAAAGAGA